MRVGTSIYNFHFYIELILRIYVPVMAINRDLVSVNANCGIVMLMLSLSHDVFPFNEIIFGIL